VNSEIDDDVGGLAVAAGIRHRGYLHDASLPGSAIPDGTIPAESWHRTTYRPGDLLMFAGETPHSGLVNRSSDQLRLSMDVRVMLASDRRHVVGRIGELDDHEITIRGDGDETTTLTIDEHTYVRGATRAEVALSTYTVGDRVLVPYRDGRALVVRPSR
jgi:hypothetical protein